MANKRTKVRRESVVECIACSLCNNLLVEATTISLCLYTFCRICIYKKLADNVFDGCPVCDINLGCNPLDKLRSDHNVQYIREKIFPVNERKVEAPESPQAVPSVSRPAKRKERLLSSLISTPRESVQTSATCRRKLADITKSPVSSGSNPCIEEHSDEELLEDHVGKPSLSETLHKTIQKNNLVDLRNPSNCLVEVANGTKFKAVTSSAHDAAIAHVEENRHKTKIQDDKNDIQSATAPTKRKRGRPPKQNTKNSLGESESLNSMPVAVRHHHQSVAIWFSLVASEGREGAYHLPQISSGFLRIKCR